MDLRAVVFIVILTLCSASKWPYHRYEGLQQDSGKFKPNESNPEYDGWPENRFIDFLRGVVETDKTGELQKAFVNGTIPPDVKWFDDLLHRIDVPSESKLPPLPTSEPKLGPFIPHFPLQEATQLFAHLGFPLDPRCTVDRSRWWYRTYDGACNWLRKDQWSEGAMGMPKSRDYNQHYYADGISEPRKGPNARAVSNAFFKRKKLLYYEHTPLLLGLIEFIMHDVTYSQDSTEEFIDVEMPDDEQDFPKNTSLRVWRTAAVPGTGTSKANPRENVNMATTWIDISSLYGSTPEVATALRSHSGGKLLTQELLARGTKANESYLPFNTMDVPTRTRPGVDPKTLFAGGDPRTNEDWVMLGVHTLLLREHNRLCGILAGRHPEYDDEQIYQTIRLVMSAKYALIANSYQMAYWTKDMPWPRDDGFPLYRQMYGETALQINPANTYPWPLVTKAGKPMVVSAEMSVVYRFHEFIISKFPIKDAANNTLWEQDLFETGFNASGFLDTGLENILRGMVASHIPNFKSGVDEDFRTAGKYRGKPFDVVTWSIVHEREQGLPTFNNYFRAYNEQDPAVEVPIRKQFKDFSSDPEMVAKLNELYSSPDEVDLVVGVQLDEQMFPGTTVPKSALIVSLFSLFGMGNSDRFSVGFAMMRCLLVDKPWDCHPSNALEDLLWAPQNVSGFPDFRFYDTFWVTELDFQAHGTNLLWRLITENSEIKCLQHSPLFPADPVTNPILCALPGQKVDLITLILTAIQVLLALVKKNYIALIIALIIALLSLIWYLKYYRKGNRPPVLAGWPVLGEALSFQKDPRALLLQGFAKYGFSKSSSFGIKLASLTYFVVTKPKDLDLIREDNPYEVKFSLHSFFEKINFPLIIKKVNFDSDLHTKLIRTHLCDPGTLATFGEVIEGAARRFIHQNPLAPRDGEPQRYESLNDYLDHYIATVVSRCIVGPRGYDDDKLLSIFLKFNTDAVNAMGISSLLPGFLQFLGGYSIGKDFSTVRRILIPIIQSRRRILGHDECEPASFLKFINEAVDGDDGRVADLVAIIVWGGLVNLQTTFSSTLLDIINQPKLQTMVVESLASARVSNLDTFEGQAPAWRRLRSAMFESIRLCGSITGPARVCLEQVSLPSDPDLSLPKGQVATLSAYYTHRQTTAWGKAAERYDPRRFLTADPPVGDPKFVSWGLKGPHLCPGRYFAQAVIQIMVKVLLEAYEFSPDQILPDDEKYLYSAGSVLRKKVGMTVRARSV